VAELQMKGGALRALGVMAGGGGGREVAISLKAVKGECGGGGGGE
jgi:hypothetical protein